MTIGKLVERHSRISCSYEPENMWPDFGNHMHLGGPLCGFQGVSPTRKLRFVPRLQERIVETSLAFHLSTMHDGSFDWAPHAEQSYLGFSRLVRSTVTESLSS